MSTSGLEPAPTVGSLPDWISLNALTKICDIPKLGDDLFYCSSASSSTTEVFEGKESQGRFYATTPSSGSFFCRRSLPLERFIRVREASESQTILFVASKIGLKTLLSHRVAESLGLSAMARLLALTRAHPDCPLLVLSFANGILPLGLVERVICEKLDNRLRVWSIVNNSSEAQRYAIYDKQWETMQEYPGSIVDFRILDRQDRPLSELITWPESASVILN